MSLVSSATSVEVGDILTVRVVVNPAGTAVNNAEAVIHFPPDVVQALSISKAGMFPLWVEDPSFSNTAGTISFNGGVPNPGVSSSGTVLSASFRASRSGTATFTLSDAAIRANDGMGTDVLTGSSGTQVHVTTTAPAPAPGVTPTTPSASVSGTPRASGPVSIASVTHPDQEAWYANPNPSFTWDLPASATSVQLGIDTSATANPTVTYPKAIEQKMVEGIEDGISYFTVRYRSVGTWSDTSTYTVRIDTSAPVITSHDFLYDEVRNAVLVRAAATDSLSGVTAYEVSIDGAAPIRIPAEQFLSETQVFKVRDAGSHRIVLSALDAAGNRTDIEGSFTVPASLSSQILFRVGPVGISLLAVLIALALLSLVALAAALFEWRALAGRRNPNRSTPVIRKTMHSGFLKMKENMGKDIRALDRARTRRELSREEVALYRRQMENMTALEKHLDKILAEAE